MLWSSPQWCSSPADSSAVDNMAPLLHNNSKERKTVFVGDISKFILPSLKLRIVLNLGFIYNFSDVEEAWYHYHGCKKKD